MVTLILIIQIIQLNERGKLAAVNCFSLHFLTIELWAFKLSSYLQYLISCNILIVDLEQ